jgi:uncharacterized repeat protein (TIGR03803 family)/autotransporter-associated beta strand protein
VGKQLRPLPLYTKILFLLIITVFGKLGTLSVGSLRAGGQTGTFRTKRLRPFREEKKMSRSLASRAGSYPVAFTADPDAKGLSGYGMMLRRLACVAAFVLGIAAASPVFAQYTYTTLASFDGTDGSEPLGGLVLSDGTLYGTAFAGGNVGSGDGQGTVFSVATTDDGSTPPTALALFNGTDGQFPYDGLLLSGSTLYGTTRFGGIGYGGSPTSGAGVVFSLSLPAPAGVGPPPVLARFSGGPTASSNGSQPNAGLILCGSTLYGTTSGGGAYGLGEVFSLSTTSGTLTVLASFNGKDGAYPLGRLLLCGSTLYGTTSEGGSDFGTGSSNNPINGDGEVFSLPITGGNGNLNLVASFNGANGANPNAGVIMDSHGNLYGTTLNGGPGYTFEGTGDGTVFEIAAGSKTITPLASFDGMGGSTPGSNPYADLLLSGGILYGTTYHGGPGGDSGEVFSLLADGGPLSVIAQFGNSGTVPNIGNPYDDGGLIMDASGNLYGTAEDLNGGPGTVFELTPPTWTGGGTDAKWTSGGNWGGTAPAPDSHLIFAGFLQLCNENDFAVGTQFNGIAFSAGADSFTLAGNAINLGGDIINNSTNLQTINLNLSLQQNTNLDAAAGDLSINGNISGAFALTLPGAGTVTLAGFNSYTGGTTVIAGKLLIAAASALPGTGVLTIGSAAAVQFSNGIGAVSIQSLTINSGGTLDIANNCIVVHYGSGSDPAAAIRSYLASGYNSMGGSAGNWQGTGIISSSAAANPISFSVGYADGGNPIDAANTGVPAGEIEVMYTVAGDANLSGGVDLADLVIVATDFGETGADWAKGDVNYDGNVDLSDLVIVASNFGASLSSVQASDFSNSFAAEWQLALAEVHGSDATVPEPASAALLALAGTGLLGRRRRKMS